MSGHQFHSAIEASAAIQVVLDRIPDENGPLRASRGHILSAHTVSLMLPAGDPLRIRCADLLQRLQAECREHPV